MDSDTGVNFYLHSGKVGNGVVLLPVVGIPAAVVLAAIYQYLVVYIPVVGYINILFLGGYVVGMGLTLSFLAKKSKCRSSKVLFMLGSGIGLIGLYAAWVFFFKALGGQEVSLLGLATNPQVLWELTCVTNAEGWWEGGPSGIFAWIVTGIEALVIVFGSGWMAFQAIDREVFCEECQNWCEPTAVQNLKITQEFAAALEDGEDKEDWDHFEILKLPEAESNEYPRFVGEVLTCNDCGQTTAIRMQLLSLKEGDNGPEEETKDIDGILLMSSQPA